MAALNILYIGDIVGSSGINALRTLLPNLKKKHNVDSVIVNGENATGTAGLNREDASNIFECGVDYITMGNHIWSQMEMMDLIRTDKRIIRPANLEGNLPGKGFRYYPASENRPFDLYIMMLLGRENLTSILGRTLIPPVKCPFRTALSLIEDIQNTSENNDRSPVILVEIHGDSPMEKQALGRWLDGRCTAVLGTHTHVQTADETILPDGTGYITDIGCTGAQQSISGLAVEPVISGFSEERYERMLPGNGSVSLRGVLLDIDPESKKCTNVKRLSLNADDISETASPENVLESKKCDISPEDSKLEYASFTNCETMHCVSKKMISLISPFVLDSPAMFLQPVEGTERFIKHYTDEGVNSSAIISAISPTIKSRKTPFHITASGDLHTVIPLRDKDAFKAAIVVKGCQDLKKLPYKELEERVLAPGIREFIRLNDYILLKHKVDELSVMLKIGKEIGGTLELSGPDGLLERIMNLCTRVMNCESSSVLLVDERNRELYFEIGLGEKGEAVKQVRLQFGQGIAGWVAENIKPAIVPDTSKDPRFFDKADAITEYKTRSIIAVPLIFKDKCIGVLEVLNRNGEIPFNDNDLSLLEAIGQLCVNAIDNAKLYGHIRLLYRSTIQVLANAMDSKDPYTHGHSRRVAQYAVAIAQELGMTPLEVEEIDFAGLLHDIGKIGVRDAILCKPGRLTDEEFTIIKSHPTISAQILTPIEFLADKIPIVRHHHERYDGNGYPDGLAGDNIPLGARIIGVADTFDAMTSNRSYRKGLPVDIALKELRKCSGTQFDPMIVKAFLSAFDKHFADDFEEKRKEYEEQDRILKQLKLDAGAEIVKHGSEDPVI